MNDVDNMVDSMLIFPPRHNLEFLSDLRSMAIFRSTDLHAGIFWFSSLAVQMEEVELRREQSYFKGTFVSHYYH
jgi:hypothetical protein